MPKLSIIVPTLDEGPVLDSFFSELFAIKEAKSAQIIVVDGGSSDNTRDIVIEWKKKWKNIELAGSPPGKGVALRIGFGLAKAQKIIFIDADLQYPVSEIPKVAHALSTADLVLTRRKSAPLNHRRVLSLAFSNVFGKSLLHLPASDPQSGLKGIRSSLLKKITLSSRGWELDAELIKKAAESGAKIKELPIVFSSRRAGRSKTGIVGTSANLFAGSMKLFAERMRPRAG